MSARYDAVIAGGGLSGLSLAAHLASQGWGNRSVLILDDARSRPSATSWGFWSVGPGLLDAAVSRTYDRVRIHADGGARVLALHPYRYRVVERSDLCRVVGAMVGRCPAFRLASGRVEEIRDGPDGGLVIVDGEPVRGDWVFDSVTPPPAATPVDARLAFTGWEVRCDRPVFDAAVPVLFDFRTPQADGSRFVYVLPNGAHQALVELTEFVPRTGRPPAAADRRDAIARYLAGVVGVDEYEVLRTESAVLPLRTRPARRRSGRVLTIGAAAGMVKASTGYAFQRIQRDSAAIAASLVQNGHPFATPAARSRYRVLDAVMLDVLERDPAQLELAFAQLFRGNPVERVLSFLDEATRIADDLKLMASLPPGPYLRALARRTMSRQRRP